MEHSSSQVKTFYRKKRAMSKHKSRNDHRESSIFGKSLNQAKIPFQKRLDGDYHLTHKSHQSTLQNKFLNKLKEETTLLRRLTDGLKKRKYDAYPDIDIADEFPLGAKSANVKKRYQTLLPSVKLAMEAMEQAVKARNSLNHGAVISSSKINSKLKSSRLVGRVRRHKHPITPKTHVSRIPMATGNLYDTSHSLSRLRPTTVGGPKPINGQSHSLQMKNPRADASPEYNEIEGQSIAMHRPVNAYSNGFISNPRSEVKRRHCASPKVRKVEQILLCTRPGARGAQSAPILCEQPICDTKPVVSDTISKYRSSEIKCKCKSTKQIMPCICRCDCEDEVICDMDEIVPSHMSSSKLNFVCQESIDVQTSFPSSIAPCNPLNCPGRRKKYAQCRATEAQTDDIDVEWRLSPSKAQTRVASISVCEIPCKRTTAMDDRLMRRIKYFDCRKKSVANKNLQFCVYNVNKMGCPKVHCEKEVCSDCPGSRKCNLVLCTSPLHLTCNEVIIEVNSLELTEEGFCSLKAVCNFVYIDYVFLGHVGNETNLAPLSNNVVFDSRKSFSLSLKFNKKERSILREQVNPTCILKETVMFLVVCQASPEFRTKKNRDFGFGYLSMKQIGEDAACDDKLWTTVDMYNVCGGKCPFGKLQVYVYGLEVIKTIKYESLNCNEPDVDAMMMKLQMNARELRAYECENPEPAPCTTIRRCTKFPRN